MPNVASRVASLLQYLVAHGVMSRHVLVCCFSSAPYVAAKACYESSICGKGCWAHD